MSYLKILKQARDMARKAEQTSGVESVGMDDKAFETSISGLGGLFDSPQQKETPATEQKASSKLSMQKKAVKDLSSNFMGLDKVFGPRGSMKMNTGDIDEKIKTDAKTFAGKYLGPEVSEQLDKISNYSFELPKSVADNKPLVSAINRVAKKHQFDPEHLFANIHFETSGTFSPSIRNAQAGQTATGLIQFIEKTAKHLGTSTEELSKMSDVEQMEWVDKYFSQYDLKDASRADVYMAILWPRAIGKDNDYPLWRKGTESYKVNSKLDINGDGVVTKGEAAKKVDDKWNKRNG